MRGEPKERPLWRTGRQLAFESGHVSQHVRLLYVPPNVFGMQLAVSLWKHSFKSLLYLPSHYAECPSPPLCTQTRAQRRAFHSQRGKRRAADCCRALQRWISWAVPHMSQGGISVSPEPRKAKRTAQCIRCCGLIESITRALRTRRAVPGRVAVAHVDRAKHHAHVSVLEIGDELLFFVRQLPRVAVVARCMPCRVGCCGMWIPSGRSGYDAPCSY